MASLAQKKFSLRPEQKEFLDAYKCLGFSDQSSIVREALDRFIKDFKTKERKKRMSEKATELLLDYTRNQELTVFTDLDGEEFL